MDGHIRQLHCRYRILGDRGSIGNVTRRLERVAKQELMQAYEAAMELHFGNDPGVVVLHSVHSRHLLPLDQMPSNVQLARKWGERLAATVVHRVSEAGPDDVDIVRFANQADYTARFLADLLQGQAWGRWYYGAFRYLHELPLGEAVTRLLSDNRDHLHEVLVLLSRRKILDGLLNAVDVPTLRALWFSGLRTTTGWVSHFGNEDALHLFNSWVATGRLSWPADVDEAFLRTLDQIITEFPWLDGLKIKAEIIAHIKSQSSVSTPQVKPGEQPSDAGSISEPIMGSNADRALFDQACRLIDTLQIWSDSRRHSDDLFAHYQPGVIADWRDVRALTRAVSDALEYLFKSGQVRSFNGPLPDGVLSRLEQALVQYSWLDTTRVRTQLLEWLIGHAAQGGERAALTPRQQTLVDEFRSVFHPHDQFAAKDAHALALRLYARLIERYPHWSGDPLALRLIEAVAYARMALAIPSAQHALLAAVQSGGVEKMLSILPAGAVTGAREGLQLLAAMGPSALALLDENTTTTGEGPLAIDTHCAGVFLLVRAITDLKLPLLSASTAYPPGEDGVRPVDLILPLLLRLAGAGSVIDGVIDAGLSRVLHATSSSRLDALRTSWSAVTADDHLRFQATLLQVLAGQRFVTGKHLHLYALSAREGGPALIAGDGQGLLWPLGCATPLAPIESQGLEGKEAGNSGDVLKSWMDIWSQGLDASPELVVADTSLIGSSLVDGGISLLLVGSEVQQSGDVDTGDPEVLHAREREALVTALRAVRAGAMGLAQADVAMALLAITVLRTWARWLPRFSTTSIAHLLENFIHREGTLFVDSNSLVVEMEPASLDVVMEMAGYTGELEKVDWLGSRRVQFRIRR